MPPFQNESKWSLSYENGFALRLALKQRHKRTRKWHINKVIKAYPEWKWTLGFISSSCEGGLSPPRVISSSPGRDTLSLSENRVVNYHFSCSLRYPPCLCCRVYLGYACTYLYVHRAFRGLREVLLSLGRIKREGLLRVCALNGQLYLTSFILIQRLSKSFVLFCVFEVFS